MSYCPDPIEPYQPYWPADLCYDWFVLPVVRDGILVGSWERGFNRAAAVQHPTLPLWLFIHCIAQRTWMWLLRGAAGSVEIYRVLDRSCGCGRIACWL